MCFFVAPPVIDATRLRENWLSLSVIMPTPLQKGGMGSSATFCGSFARFLTAFGLAPGYEKGAVQV